MRVLATVGTGRFEALVTAMDARYDPRLLIQHGAGPAPQVNAGVDYIPTLDDKLDEFDLVISHAGAGTVYAMLERGRRFCVVPNLDRTDDHQCEISNYLQREGLAPVLDLDEAPFDLEVLNETAAATCNRTLYPGPSFDYDLFIESFLR